MAFTLWILVLHVWFIRIRYKLHKVLNMKTIGEISPVVFLQFRQKVIKWNIFIKLGELCDILGCAYEKDSSWMFMYCTDDLTLWMQYVSYS